jgi:monoamine oxidase
MVSYTDGAEAYAWEAVRKEHGDDAVKRMLLEQLRELFPEKEIPSPEWFRMEFWKEGAHYWTPGADLRMETMRERIHPEPTLPMYVTGEVISPLNQAWVEGALEMAEETTKIIQEGL